MKKTLIIIINVIAVFVLFWAGSYLKYEILTAKHGQEFAKLYKQTNMISKVDDFKVMKYSENEACVYYITENTFGNMITFTKQNNEWILDNWETIWSKSGSANGFIWPWGR